MNRYFDKGTYLLILLLSFFLVPVPKYCTGQETSISVHQEGVEVIKTHFVGTFFEKSFALPLKEIVQQLDNFSDYLTPEEFRELQVSQNDKYSGIGLEIEKTEDNKILCFPLPGTPAEAAGVHPEDILLSVNGIRTDNLSLYSIAAITRGPEGSNVSVTIQNKQGKTKQFIITRSKIESDSVSIKQQEEFQIITIVSFTKDTRKKLEKLLKKIKGNFPLILDVRDNRGGDLYQAIDCAMLFLKPTQPIVRVIKKQNVYQYQSTTPALPLQNSILIFQNRRTASAAEVFTAALSQNKRAVTIGETTYGKGRTQDIFKLSNGSALILTAGRLIPPDGKSYNGKGLSPQKKVTEKSMKAYLKMARSLLPSVPTIFTTAKAPSGIKKDTLQKERFQVDKIETDRSKTTTSYYTCINKLFSEKKNASQWTHTHPQLDKMGLYSIFQKKTDNGIMYQVCLGPSDTKKEAENLQRTIVIELGLSTIIQTFSQEIFSSEKDFKKEGAQLIDIPLPLQNESWYILAGSYHSSEQLLSRLQQVKSRIKYLQFAVCLESKGMDAEIYNNDLSVYKNANLNILTTVPAEIADKKDGLYHNLFIGHYPKDSSEIMLVLKKKLVVPENAVWVRYEVKEMKY